MHNLPQVIGKHALYELHGGNPLNLNDEEFVKKSLCEAAEAAGAKLLGVVSHKFEPQGVTAVALLSESHISLHSWPEFGYASIDCYTCGAHTDPEAACKSLKDAFEATYSSIHLLRREGPSQQHLPA